MCMERLRVRIRLVFEGQQILSKTQKKQGLKKSWILFKPKHFRTISDLSTYLVRIFDLHTTCPHGLVLSMDGFVLPLFESTCILKDNDTICVRRKRGESTEIIELDNGLNALEETLLVKRPVGLKLLANEEFEKDKGRYESKHKEDEQEKSFDVLQLEDPPNRNKVFKKRKASKKLQGPKRKKSRLSTAEESPIVPEDVQNVDHEVKSGRSHQDKSTDVEGEPEKSSSPEIDETRSSQLQENGEGNVDLSSSPVGTKMVPSRSARRKKAKRQWLREQAKLEKMELDQKQLLAEDNLQSLDKDYQNHSDKHQQPDPDFMGKDNKRLSEEFQRPDPNSDGNDDFVPVVIRPGHIRFEPLVDAVQAVQQNQIPVETFQWNGITSKKKGQKWGKEKASFSKRNNYENFNQFSESLTIEEEIPKCKDVNFDKLPPYASLPKEGDIIAYRLIELSSSWTPEPTAFRVGKISWYDSESNRIILAPVAEYPIAFEKKIDEDASEIQSDNLYGEDGSLQIDFPLLTDVRIVMRGGEVNEVCGRNQDAITNLRDNNEHEKAKAPTLENGKVCVGNQDAALTNATDNSNNEITHAHAQENGKVNAWEEISQFLSAKKAELSQVDDQSTKGSSNCSRWSYKALRRSALGPTMAFLRSENGL